MSIECIEQTPQLFSSIKSKLQDPEKFVLKHAGWFSTRDAAEVPHHRAVRVQHELRHPNHTTPEPHNPSTGLSNAERQPHTEAAGCQLTVRHREVCKRLHDEVVWQDPRLKFGEHLLHHLVDEALPHRNKDVARSLLPVPDHLLARTEETTSEQTPRQKHGLPRSLLLPHLNAMRHAWLQTPWGIAQGGLNNRLKIQT